MSRDIIPFSCGNGFQWISRCSMCESRTLNTTLSAMVEIAGDQAVRATNGKAVVRNST